MFDLQGKTALVAGGAGYLAVPACLALAKQGANVIIADIDTGRIERTVQDIKAGIPGARVDGIVMDVADDESVEQAVRHVVGTFGGLQVMVNSTYYSVGKLVEEISPDEFDRAMRVNLTGALMLARESAQAMRDGGSIIMVSSMYGQVAPDPRVYEPPMRPNPIEYGVAKAGIIQMVKYLAVYWGSRDIRVNAIAPGPFPHQALQQENPAFVQRLAGKTPLGRIGRQDELAGAVVFLASDESSYVTGETIAVNGGWTAW